MSESLTPFEGENLASYEALKTAIGLADGFTLIFAVTNTEAGAQEVMRRLWREGVRYQKAWLRDPERPLVDQVVEGVCSARLPVMVLGLEGLTTVGEELGRSLRNLNWTRPQWTARLPQTLVFWVTADMEPLLAREAPDLWRFRSLRVEFTFGFLPRAARASELRRRLRKLNLGPRVRLAALMELFSLTRSQGTLGEASHLVLRTLELPWQGDFQYLRILVLASPQVDDRSIERIGVLPFLKRFDLENTGTTDEGVAKMLQRADPVNLEHAQFIRASGGPLTFATLSALPRFTRLTVVQQPLGTEFLKSVHAMVHLSELDVFSDSIKDREFEGLCRGRGLSVLNVHSASISDEGAKHVGNLRRLWSLGLSGSKISSHSLMPISQLQDLRFLDVSATEVSDKHLEILSNLSRLQRVDLRWSKVTEDGASRLRKIFVTQRRKVEVLL